MLHAKKAFKEMGFVEKNKYFQHKGCPWFVEFVSPPVAVGNEPIQEFNQVKTSCGQIKLLRPIDSIKDRLAGFYHWNDKQNLEQALNICLEHNIDLEEIKQWSFSEGHGEKYAMFSERLKKAKPDI